MRLLQADEGLAAGIPADELDFARRVVVAEARRLGAGDQTPSLTAWCGDRGFAALVLEGALTREIRLLDRRSTELLGPGDVLRVANGVDRSLVPHTVSWSVVQASTLAVLDDRFTMAARRWPALGLVVTERLLEQGDRLARHVAIAQLNRVELRLLAMLWHLADRWGRVTADGVTVPLKLTHESLGRLVGAQRPTVTLALADLGRASAIARDGDGFWRLAHGSREMLGGAARDAAG